MLPRLRFKTRVLPFECNECRVLYNSLFSGGHVICRRCGGFSDHFYRFSGKKQWRWAHVCR